jgi:hypothetical protein
MNSNLKKILLASIFTIGISISATAKQLDNLGKEINLQDKTKVSEIMKSPEDFIGKNILIEGKVVDVCTERGCWMKVSSDKKRESLTIKVKDGEMVFPIEARGKNVLIEGELFKVVMKKKEAEEMKKDGHDHHHEKKEGKTVYMFKPKGVKFSE